MNTLATIVLVDDSQDDLFLTNRLLAHAGVTNPIITFDNAKSAMAVLQAAACSSPGLLPSLIISDLKMPGMDGIELLRFVRETPNLQHIPFAILTGGNFQQDRVRAEEWRPSAFLIKFPAADVLASLAKAAIAGKLTYPTAIAKPTPVSPPAQRLS